MEGVQTALLALIAPIFSAILTPFLSLGQYFAGAVLVIFALAALIRGILMVAETVLDEGSTSSLFAKLGRGGAIVLIISVILASWGAIQAYTLIVVSEATMVVQAGFNSSGAGGSGQSTEEAFAQASAGGPPAPPPLRQPIPPGVTDPRGVAQFVTTGIIRGQFETLIRVVTRIQRLYEVRILVANLSDALDTTPPPGVDMDAWIDQMIQELEARPDNRSIRERISGMGNALVVGLQGVAITFMAVICAMIFAVFCLYYLTGALIVMLVALGLGPAALALAPIDQGGFAKSLFGTLVASAIQFAIVANLVNLLASVINWLTLTIISNAEYAMMGAGPVQAAHGHATTFLIPILCLVFAFMIPKVLGTVSEIFSGGRNSVNRGVMKYVTMGLAAAAGGAKLIALGRAAGAAAGGKGGGSGPGSVPKP